MFYLFGKILLVTAGQMLKPGTATNRSANNIVVRLAMRFMRTCATYDRDKLLTIDRGRRVMTPMLLVMVIVIAGLLIVTVTASLVSANVPAAQVEHLAMDSRSSHHDASTAGVTAWPAGIHLHGKGGHTNGTAKRRLSLLSGILVVVALVLVLLAATVTSGAIDGFEIGVALVLLVVSYLVQRDVRRTTYERRPDDEPPPPTSSL